MQDPLYAEAVILYAVSALVEAAVAPLFVLASVQLRFGVRTACDSLALVVRAVTEYALVLHMGQQVPVLRVFAYAQLASSCAYAAAYLLDAAMHLDKGSFALNFNWGKEERDVLRISTDFGVQAVVKLALSEGSKYVAAASASRAAQGILGLVDRLASLLVRLLLAPLEDLALTTFASAAASAGSGVEERAQLGRLLRALTRCVALLGLMAVAFGPPHAYVLLRAMYGTRWSDTEAPVVLSAYCGFVLALAINGMTEAFAHAVLPSAQLRASNALLLLFAAAHLALSRTLAPHGAVGIVAADTASMALRITYSLWCIQRYFVGVQTFSLWRLLPGPLTLAYCAAGGALSRLSDHHLRSSMAAAAAGGGGDSSAVFWRLAAQHVAAGAACVCAVLVLCGGTSEREVLRDTAAMLQRRRRKKME